MESRSHSLAGWTAAGCAAGTYAGGSGQAAAKGCAQVCEEAAYGLQSRRSRERYLASPSCSFHDLSVAAWPRSPILKTPSELMRMLSGLTSQWITAWE
eukprot:scaffold9864_cov124-Isochrysis_galbana.AAC.5